MRALLTDRWLANCRRITQDLNTTPFLRRALRTAASLLPLCAVSSILLVASLATGLSFPSTLRTALIIHETTFPHNSGVH
jgi:hypothetical protein